jgi:hypothetical protein
MGYTNVANMDGGVTAWRERATRPSDSATVSGHKLLAVELGTFGFFGLFWGVFAVLLADLTRAHDLSPGPLGLALFVGASASILVMASLGWSFMSLLHAAFSGGAMVGAIGAGVVIQAGADYRMVFLALLVPLASVILVVAPTRFPAAANWSFASDEGKRTGGLTRHLPLLLVGVIATLGLLSEGEMEHWSGIYLRHTLGLPAVFGGSGVAVFYAAMAAGRLGTAWAVRSFGNHRTLLVAGLFTAEGMGLALATREPLLVVCGFLVVGLALSAVAPIAFSAAGDLAPERAGWAISVVTTLGYGGFLLGPVVVGALAELLGLRIALSTIAAAGVLISALALRLKKTA